MKNKALFAPLALWFTLGLLHSAPLPPPERLLPDTTLAVLTAPDYPAAIQWYRTSPGGKLLDDPAMKPFMDKLSAKFKKDVVEPLEKELGIKFSDYEGLAQGQVTLAITAGRWEGNIQQTPAFLFLMDTRDKSEQLGRNLADIRKKWSDAGKPLKTEKVRDAQLSLFTFMSDDVRTVFERVFPDPNAGWESITPGGLRGGPARRQRPAENREITLVLGQSGPLMVLGTSLEEIKKVLDLQAGEGGRCLADVPAFQNDQARLLRGSHYYGWLNLKTVVELALKGAGPAAANPNNPMAVNPAQVVNALGLNGVQSAVVSLHGDPRGTTVQFFLGVPEADRKGLFKILTPQPADAAPPPFIPADAVKYTRIRYDFGKAWDTLEETLNNINPGLLGALSFFEGAIKQQNPNFSLRRSLIDQLGDDVIIYEFKPTTMTLEGLNNAPGLVLLSSPQPEKLAETIKTLGNLASTMRARGPRGGGARDAEPPTVKQRQVQGRTLYTLPPTPQMNFQGQRIGERSLSFCATANYLAMSYDTDLLEQFVRGAKPAKNLSTVPQLAEAAKEAGGFNTGIFHFENQVETMRAAFSVFRKEGPRLGELLGMTPLGGRLGFADDSKAFQDWFDFTLLPAYERVSKYFGITVFTGSATPEGLLIKSYTPNPPGFK